MGHRLGLATYTYVNQDMLDSQLMAASWLSSIIIIINDSIYPAVSKASRTGNKVSCQPNDCPNR